MFNFGFHTRIAGGSLFRLAQLPKGIKIKADLLQFVFCNRPAFLIYLRNFDEQIQDVIDGKFPENDHVYVMETPEVLQSIGLKKLPMLRTQKHAYTTTMAEGKYRSTDVNYHALGLETMKQLPNAIADPLMVIKSHNYDGRITVITELTDGEGHGIIVPVIVNGRGVWENVKIPSNVIASVFGKKNIANTLKNAFKSEDVLYIDKKRSDLIAQTLGGPIPRHLERRSLFC